MASAEGSAVSEGVKWVPPEPKIAKLHPGTASVTLWYRSGLKVQGVGFRGEANSEA